MFYETYMHVYIIHTPACIPGIAVPVCTYIGVEVLDFVAEMVKSLLLTTYCCMYYT